MAAKLLWRGAECWKESLMLLSAAEAAIGQLGHDDPDSFIVRRRFDSDFLIFRSPFHFILRCVYMEIRLFVELVY